MKPAITTARKFADERIGTIAEQAKAEGLKVYTSTGYGTIKYVLITDGTHIASLSTRDIICIGTSSVHKPCRECGTGFGLKTSDEHTVDLQAVREAMNTHAPKWATPRQWKAVRKYASWEEYAQANGWARYSEL